jgi:hypothetical protein
MNQASSSQPRPARLRAPEVVAPTTSPAPKLRPGPGRIVAPEWLDTLPADDPRARRARGDLRRLNWLMRHAPLLCAALRNHLAGPPAQLVELGAGDGSLALALARELHGGWPGVRVRLIDRQATVSAATLAGFQKLGWPAQATVADAFDWLREAEESDVIFANLFLHHFTDAQLTELLGRIAARTRLFLALETRRAWPSFAVSRLLGLLGCNAVTRNDAVLSMKAGFEGRELSALWPQDGAWQLEERPAVVFTHLFIARRRS